MHHDEFALRVEHIRLKLYKTALTYLGNESLALDAVDEAVYKALCGRRKLRQPEFFDTWITRILINECHNELRRQKRQQPLDASLPSNSKIPAIHKNGWDNFVIISLAENPIVI